MGKRFETALRDRLFSSEVVMVPAEVERRSLTPSRQTAAINKDSFAAVQVKQPSVISGNRHRTAAVNVRTGQRKSLPSAVDTLRFFF
jgi:hypothetical protein